MIKVWFQFFSGCLLFWLMVTGQSSFAFSQSSLKTEYIHEKWQTERGLPFDTVLGVTQTADGHLWLGLGRGAARFDGVRFTYFNRENTPELPENEIKNPTEDRAGNLWMTSNAGLVRYRDGKFTLFTTAHGLPDNITNAVHEDRAGNLWIGTNKGLARWTGDGFAAVPEAGDERIYRFAEQTDGTVLLAAYSRILSLRPDTFEIKPFLEVPRVLAILVDRRGQLWLGSAEGLIHYAGNQPKHYTTSDGLPTNYVQKIVEDGEGNIWIGTGGEGLVRWNGKTFSVFNSQQGLSEDSVKDVFKDRNDIIWVATNGGLDQLRRNPFGSFTKLDGLTDNHVWAVYEDRAGALWIGTNSGGVNRIFEGKVTKFQTTDGLPSDLITSLLELSDGTMIVGTGKGLAKIRDGRVSLFDYSPDSHEWRVSAMFQDADGGLWLGTRELGLIYLRDGYATHYKAESGMTDNPVRSIKPAADGGLWIAAHSLFYFRDGNFRSWSEAEGVSGGVFALYPDGNRIWFGTYSGGLYLLDGDKLTSFSPRATGLSKMIFSILEDGAGNFWLSFGGGLQSVSKQELLDYAAGTRKTLRIDNFDRRDGLSSSEFNTTGSNAGWKLADGRMMFANSRGAVIFNPSEVKTNPPQPTVYITEVLYNNQPIGLASARLELPPGGEHLEFRYSAPYFTNPTRLRFRYKLEGFDQTWRTTAEAERAANYTNLPPGNYRFRVMVSNGDGVWNESAAVLSFRLRPYFYQTSWFYGVCAVAAVLALFGIYRWRVHRLRRSARLLEKEVGDRTSELRGEIAVRQKAEELLLAARDDLKNQVQNRTAELAEANSVLREQREFLYVTLASVGDAVIVTDEKGLVTFLNPVAQNLTGWQSDEALGQPLSAVLSLAGDENGSDNAVDRLNPADDGSSPMVRRQARLLTQTGEQIPVEIQFSAIQRSSNQDIGAVITFWDMRPQLAAETERRKLEEQLFQSQKMESIGTLAGGVAHDFNNLLTVVLVNADLMSRRLDPDDPLNRRVRDISQAAERGADVTRQLLTFSRQQALERRPLDLDTVIGELLKLLKRVIGEQIEIQVKLEPDLPAVLGDSSQLGQVLMNLIVNARDAMPKGGTIEISAARAELDEEFCQNHKWARPGSFVRLDVADNGAGMDEQTLQRLFEPFFTTKETGKGTGLGLSVVYGIIQQHQGLINVTSEIGVGTTFSIYLPATASPTEPERTTSPEAAPNGRRETILLADDEESLREMTREILESYNYRVLTAADGAEAVEIYRRNADQIRLLLFDVNMPKMDGREAYEHIRKLSHRVPVLFVTGYNEGFLQQPDFFNHPGRALLAKPYLTESLLLKVREMLDKPG